MSFRVLKTLHELCLHYGRMLVTYEIISKKKTISITFSYCAVLLQDYYRYNLEELDA
jgi:hypothetical protein